MPDKLNDLTQSLLSAAKKAGADGADALAVDGTSVSIEVKNNALEHAERAEGIDIGLRVFVGQRQACVSASDISARTIETMAERAVAMAREAPEDAYIGLATPDELAQDWDVAALELSDPAPEPSAKALEEDARAAEAAALAVYGVAQVQAASAGYGARRIHLAASNGFSGGYSRTDRATSAVAIAGEGTGMERDWASEMRIFGADMPSPESIGLLAGERTVERIGATRPKTGSYPVLFDERVAGSLIGHLLAAITSLLLEVPNIAMWGSSFSLPGPRPRPGRDLSRAGHLARPAGGGCSKDLLKLSANISRSGKPALRLTEAEVCLPLSVLNMSLRCCTRLWSGEGGAPSSPLGLSPPQPAPPRTGSLPLHALQVSNTLCAPGSTNFLLCWVAMLL